MIQHRIQYPAQILLGREAMATVAREQSRADRRRWLLVTESEIQDSGITDQVNSAFENAGLSLVTFTGFDSGAISSSAEEALELARAGFIEAVIGIGTAPTIHLGRVVAALIGAPRIGVDEVIDNSRVKSPGVAFLSVPSSPFDPLLCSPKAFVIDARNWMLRMIELQSPAEYVVYDASVFGSTTRVQALFALSAAILLSVETLVNAKRNPVSLPLANRVIEHGATLLEAIAEGDEIDPVRLDSIRDLSLLASVAAGSTGPGPGTYLAATIHARTGFGLASAVPSIAAPTAARLLSATDVPELEVLGESPESVESRLRELFGAVGLPLRLKDVGFDPRDTSGVIDNLEALESTGQYSGVLGADDIEAIVDSAL